eukprot:5037624-Pyramimonas_sp.AAC.1
MGKGSKRLLAGGTNWTACMIRTKARNIVLLAVYRQSGAGYNNFNIKVAKEISVFLTSLDL